MRRLTTALPARSVWVLSVSLFLWLASDAIHAQDLKSSEPHLEDAVITKLAPLVYPRLARQTRISGDIITKLEVRKDGSVASAVVVSGHPLLAAAALDNAQKSTFACEHCGEETRFYRLVYTFKLPETTNEPSDSPGITQSPGRVTIVGDLPMITDFGPMIYHKVRSIKCLYLWRCGYRPMRYE